MPDMCPPSVRRQGDVLLVELDELPPQLEPVPREDGRLVLAHGEATGHAHVLEGEAELLAADLDEMRERFLRVEAESSLLHEEHATVPCPRGSTAWCASASTCPSAGGRLRAAGSCSTDGRDSAGLMAEKLDRLSAEQLALLADVRDQWLAVGLAAEPADRPQAERGARLAYEAAGLPVPPLVLWLRSPLEGVVGLTTLRHLGPVQNQLGRQVKSSVNDQIKNRVGGRVEQQVLAQVWDQVFSVEREIKANVGGQLRDQIADRGEDLLTDLTDQVRKQVEDQIEAQVGHRQADHLLGHRRCLAGREDLHAPTLLGQHDAVQLAFYDAFRRLGIGAADRLEGLMAVARAAGWWWAFRGLVVLTERPCRLHRDREGRLHGDRGPALLYPDGFGIWAWHGVRVPRDVIERRLEPGRIARESNVEVRRVMIERYGLERYLRAVDATKLDEVHEPPFPGLLDARLWRAEMVGDEPLCVVELVNSTPEPDGSARSYMLRVPPDVETAQQAVAWTFGMAERDYHPVVES